VSSLLSNTSPLFVALGIIALSRGRTRVDAVLGILVGFCGLAVVVFGESPASFGQLALNPLGVGLSLVGSVTWALYIGLGRQAMAKGNGLAVVVASACFGGLPWLAVAAANGDLWRYLLLAPADWALLLFLGAVGTGLTYGLWTAALARLSAASVAVFQYAIPFWAVVLSVMLLSERVTVPLVVGGAMIVGGIALTQRATRRATRRAQTAAASSRA
jgi:drug/metabolite transporter (DMT)-like permease